jgi:Zn-dependent M28 family amino/carboxypeptidase
MADLQQRLLADLQQFAVHRHARWDPLGLMAVRQALRERLAELGPLEEHRFCTSGEEGVNLILRLPGRDPKLPPLLVGAHYDGPLHSPGADDNASGVAALLELARRWAVDPPRRPVWLVAFDQEEWGMVGSAALAQELREAKHPLQLMASLEMLAFTSEAQSYPVPGMEAIYGNRGDFIALVANTGSTLMLPGLAHALGAHVPTKVLPVPMGGRQIPDVRLSDHSPFWDAGYNALMVTDTSFMRNPHYHRMTDTVETLNLGFFSAVVEGLAAAFSQL